MQGRVRQNNKITRRRVRRATRPRTPHDQRTNWAARHCPRTNRGQRLAFGATCPAKGKAAGQVMSWCNMQAVAVHLAEISKAVDPDAHAVMILDQARWHISAKVAIPDNITLLRLPPRSPEFNPVENIWQNLCDNWLSNRIFQSYADIAALCCEVCNKLIERPWKIMSIGTANGRRNSDQCTLV